MTPSVTAVKYYHSKETRLKMSESAKCRQPISEETRQKISMALKGHSTSEETKTKISRAQKDVPRLFMLGNKYRCGKKLSNEHKTKLITSRKNMIMTNEYKNKISKALKGCKNTLGRHWKCSEEAKIRMSIGQKGKKVWNKGLLGFNSGDKNGNWRGGISIQLYPLGWTNTHKEQIRFRDGYKCQICGLTEVEHCRKLSVHHIDYIKENIEPNNLISLCTSCHMKTNRNRDFWKNHFITRTEYHD